MKKKEVSLSTFRLIRDATERQKTAGRSPRLDRKYTVAERDTFLIHSNRIEGVWDEGSFNDAVKAWQYLMTQKNDLTAQAVLKTHALLMARQRIEGHLRGAYRDCDVYVGNNKMMATASIPYAMEEWLRDMNTASPTEWKNLHIRYEHIHPFIDGNGRTGRMFMNWFRLKKDMPILAILKDPHIEDYYAWFRPKEPRRGGVKRYI